MTTRERSGLSRLRNILGSALFFTIMLGLLIAITVMWMRMLGIT